MHGGNNNVLKWGKQPWTWGLTPLSTNQYKTHRWQMAKDTGQSYQTVEVNQLESFRKNPRPCILPLFFCGSFPMSSTRAGLARTKHAMWPHNTHHVGEALGAMAMNFRTNCRPCAANRAGAPNGKSTSSNKNYWNTPPSVKFWRHFISMGFFLWPSSNLR